MMNESVDAIYNVLHSQLQQVQQLPQENHEDIQLTGNYTKWRVKFTLGNDIVVGAICLVLLLHLMTTILLIYYRLTVGKFSYINLLNLFLHYYDNSPGWF